MLSLALSLVMTAALPSDVARITDGVGELNPAGGLIGGVVADGKNAFPVLTGKIGKGRGTIMAAARAGKGRIVVLGHESFFSEAGLGNPSNARLLNNALSWLSPNKTFSRVVGLDMKPRNLPAVTRDTLRDVLKTTDILLMNQSSLDGDPKLQKEVVAWVKRGGGLLIAGPAWGWAMLNPQKSLARDHGGNAIAREFGLGFAEVTPEGPWSSTGADDPALTLRGALANPTAPGAGATLESALGAGFVGLDKEIRRRAAQEGPVAYPTEAKPLDASRPFARALLRLESNQPIQGAHPAAADFPGLVDPAAPRVTKTVTMTPNVAHWHSTGLYANAGEPLVITVPEAGSVPSVRIGAHTDTLWHLSDWKRYPNVSRTFTLKRGRNEITSPFGGLVYLDAGDDARADWAKITLAGAVEAPVYKSGETSSVEWKRLRVAGAPWAEIVGKHIAITVPAKVVRELNDPQEVADYYDKMLVLAAELYAVPVGLRQERFTADRQISAGYMHSGYPIMTWLDVEKRYVDMPVMKGKPGAQWGFYHELGHNFQRGDWTYEGMGEVTNNLFSLYGSEKFNGVTIPNYGDAHPALKLSERRARLTKYLRDGKPYSFMQQDPWMGLEPYIQIRETFGWEALTKAFAAYEAMSPAEKPKTEEDRRDRWLIEISRATGRNLAPFFANMGIPVRHDPQKQVSGFPVWEGPNYLIEAKRAVAGGR